MRVAGIGNSCIDLYEKLNRQYPSGNVVTTGVNLKKLGAAVSIISTVGNDDNGKWVIETLKNEGLDVSHIRTAEGQTAIAYKDLVDGKLINGDFKEGVLKDIVYDEEDVRFACEHDLIHTAVWDKSAKILPQIAQTGLPISFDYSDQFESPLVEETLPYVTYGFYSYHKGKDDYIKNFLIDKVNRGMKVAVATFGEEGSLAYDSLGFHQGNVIPSRNVVNKAGAGDTFIAGFLYGILSGYDVLKCLRSANKVARGIVEVFEPWIVED